MLSCCYKTRDIFRKSYHLKIRATNAKLFVNSFFRALQNFWRIINSIGPIWWKICLFVCPETVSLPSILQLSSSFTLGKHFASRNRYFSQTNIKCISVLAAPVYIYWITSWGKRFTYVSLSWTYFCLEACIRNTVKQTLVDVISYNIIESYVSPAELSTTNFPLNVTVYGLEKSITL